MKYQVTLMNKDNKYRPVSTIVECVGMSETEIKQKGIQKICFKRGWGSADLKKYGYTLIKMREYDQAKIEFENKLKYLAKKQKQERGI